MLAGGSLIQSRFGKPGNFEALLWHPEASGVGPVRHFWRANHEPDRPDEGWHASAVVLPDAAGPGCLIQSEEGHLEAIIPQGGRMAYCRMDADAKQWRLMDTFGSRVTGAGALCQNLATKNLEVLVRQGKRLIHYRREKGEWKEIVTISDRATGPAVLVPGRGLELEAIVPEGKKLVHYHCDPRTEPVRGYWTVRGIITERATGPAGLVNTHQQSPDSLQYIVIVQEKDTLRSYSRKDGAEQTPWVPGPLTIPRGDSIKAKAIALAYSNVLGGSLEVMTEEENGSVFHYFTLGKTPRTWQWRRGTCLRVEEGPVVNRGTSEKVEQLTGQIDFTTRQPKMDADKHKIRGTDLGAAFQHNGRTYFLFGDTHWVDHRCAGTRDVIAFTERTSAERGLNLMFQRGCIDIRGGNVTMMEYDVPLDGFSHEGEMYVFLTSDHFRYRWVMGRSVLTRCLSRDPGKDIRDSYALPDSGPHAPMGFQYLEDLSVGGAFINASVALVEGEDIRRWRLPAEKRALLLWGSGAYRADVVSLACLPLPDGPPDLRRIRYFTGVSRGVPRWSAAGKAREEEAVPLFTPAAVGELSVRWDPMLERWLLMYCTGPWDSAGLSVTMRVSKTPWGPWSPRRVVLNWQKEGMGAGKYIHLPGVEDGLNQDDTPFPRDFRAGGAAYAPYHLPWYSTRRGEKVSLYYVLSTWNPYQSVLMCHTMTNDDLKRMEERKR